MSWDDNQVTCQRIFSCLVGQSFGWFLQHEALNSISTHVWKMLVHGRATANFYHAAGHVFQAYGPTQLSTVASKLIKLFILRNKRKELKSKTFPVTDNSRSRCLRLCQKSVTIHPRFMPVFLWLERGSVRLNTYIQENDLTLDSASVIILLQLLPFPSNTCKCCDINNSHCTIHN